MRETRTIIKKSIMWSSMTTLLTKAFVPISNMILARILCPEDFGIVASINIIIAFADIFTDAGFCKYIIQHEYTQDEHSDEVINVAFLSNLFISTLFYILIYSFSGKIAILVNAIGYENAIKFASLNLIATSFSSIQRAIYQRNYQYKLLFKLSIISSLIPFLITIPLALLGFSFWALIIGSLVKKILEGVFLTINSVWKPSLFYSISILYKMISFSVWTMFDNIVIWVSASADIYIISKYMSTYYVGLYKNTTTMISTLYSIITATILPILFASLSRNQNNRDEFENILNKFQRYISLLAIPMGIMILIYKELFTKIILGKQWLEGSGLFGLYALTMSISISFSYLCSETYRALGKIKYSLIIQLIKLVYFIPMCLYGAREGYYQLTINVCLVNIIFALTHYIMMQFILHVNCNKMIMNLVTSFLYSIPMILLTIFLKINFSDINEYILLTLSCLMIVCSFSLNKSLRDDLKNIICSRRIFYGKKNI